MSKHLDKYPEFFIQYFIMRNYFTLSELRYMLLNYLNVDNMNNTRFRNIYKIIVFWENNEIQKIGR